MLNVSREHNVKRWDSYYIIHQILEEALPLGKYLNKGGAMSYEGYFDSIIKIWYSKTKKTPTLKRDMKVVLQQFEASLQYEEIPEDRIEDLKRKFKKIYDEVYD